MLGLFKSTSERTCHGIKTSFQDTYLSIFMYWFTDITSHALLSMTAVIAVITVYTIQYMGIN